MAMSSFVALLVYSPFRGLWGKKRSSMGQCFIRTIWDCAGSTHQHCIACPSLRKGKADLMSPTRLMSFKVWSRCYENCAFKWKSKCEVNFNFGSSCVIQYIHCWRMGKMLNVFLSLCIYIYKGYKRTVTFLSWFTWFKTCLASWDGIIFIDS